MCGRYRGELAPLKFSVICTSFEIVKIGCEFLSSSIALGIRLGQAESCERDPQAAQGAADAKWAKTNSDANEGVELWKLQAALDLSARELTAELTKVRAELIQVTTERLESSTRLDVIAVESEKRLEELAIVRSTRDSVEELI